MSNARKPVPSLDVVSKVIEEELSKQVNKFERTFDDHQVTEWNINLPDYCGATITLFQNDKRSFSLRIDPFIKDQWGDNITFPNRMTIDTPRGVVNWFQKNYIYALFNVLNYREVTKSIQPIAKDLGFDGISIPPSIKHGVDNTKGDYINEIFEFQSMFNGIRKSIFVSVNSYKNKLIISTKCDGDWETVSRDRDAKVALEKFKERFDRYMGQLDPNPRFYLLLQNDPNCLGENIALFRPKAH